MTVIPSASVSVASPAQNRHGDRFRARNWGSLHAELLVLQEDEVVRHTCQVADISVAGCAVRVPLSNPGDLSVAVLRISDTSGSVNFEVAGRLCWNQQTTVGSHTFGFHFRRPMDARVIERMVAAGLVTRRQEPRISADIHVHVRRTPGLAAIERATLHDFSTTGLRLRVDQELRVAERLLITTATGVSGSVFVKWVNKQENEVECGCVFQNLNSSLAINGALAPS